MAEIKSMTGYGRAQETSFGLSITVEVRSVNHRYLDCSVRIPRIYIFLEEALKALVAKSVSRGKVDVFVTIDDTEAGDISLKYNETLLRAYLDALKGISETFSVRGGAELMQLARLPEVFTVKRGEADPDALKKAVLQTLSKALLEHSAMCMREGAHLKADLLSRAETIESVLPKLRARARETVTKYREKLFSRMREVLENTAIDENRILLEAALYADRTALDEEFVRLESHIAQLREILSGGGDAGRKLDFLMQEFNREVNTIGSKANDLDIARDVIDLKAEIEKMREQVQNIN